MQILSQSCCSQCSCNHKRPCLRATNGAVTAALWMGMREDPQPAIQIDLPIFDATDLWVQGEDDDHDGDVRFLFAARVAVG